MTTRSRMCSIMGVIGLEHLELFALELEKIAIFDFVYTLASTITNQSEPNLVKIYMAILKFAIFHFVYTVASTIINQLVPKLVKIYMT